MRELPGRPRFQNAVELSRILAEADRTRQCAVKIWFALSFGREADERADACTVQDLRRRFDSGGHRLRDLFLAVTETDAFRVRRPNPGGQP